MDGKNWTRGMAFFLAVVMMMLLGIPASATTEDQNPNRVVSGYCGAEENGENLSWTLGLDNGELVISGTGDMECYSNVDGNYGPWYEQYRNDVVTVKIQEGVTSISTGAFTSFGHLQSVYIPGSVQMIQSDSGASMMFEGCTNLKEIIVDDSNRFYCSKDGILFDKAMQSLLRYTPGNLQTKYEIPDGVTEIKQGAFEGASNLVRIEFPERLKKIESFAFERCTNLQTKILFPEGFEEVGDYAFLACKNVTRISLPKSLLTCGRDIFNSTKLEKIYYHGTQEEWEKIAHSFPESATIFFEKESGSSEPGTGEGNHQHALCSETTCTDPGHREEHPLIYFQAWNERDSLPQIPGNYYLTADVTLSESWRVPSNGYDPKTVLCLNGHSITCNKESEEYSLHLDWAASLTICDCIGTGEVIAPQQSTARAIENEGGQLSVYAGKLEGSFGLFNQSAAVFNLYGGSIFGYDGIHNNNSDIIIYGGSVTAKGSEDESIGLAVASGIWSQRGIIEIYGGTLVGGVHSSMGTTRIFDGTFPYAEIANEGGKMEIHGGRFQQDPSKAACIYNRVKQETDSQLMITGGTVQGKIRNSSGLTITGGIIQDTAINNNGILQLTGKPEFTDGIKTDVPVTVISDETHQLEVEHAIPILLEKTFELEEGATVVKSASRSNLDQFTLIGLSDWKLAFDRASEALYLTHKHTMTLVPATSATATNPGNIAYYICNSCNKWFSDQTGTIEITDKTSVVIPATGNGASSGASSGGGGGGASTPDSGRDTVTNPDGSITKTERKSDGTVISITTSKDGSTSRTETKADGSIITEVTVSDKAVSDAKKSGQAVKLPVEIKAGEDSKSAPTVKIYLPENTGKMKIGIPVKDVTSGTVVIIVETNGTEKIVRDSLPSKDAIEMTMDSDATVKIVNNAKRFMDIKNHWAKESIDFASARGLLNGMSETIFEPNAPTTRAQLWTILARQVGADLTGGNTWYEKAQTWAKTNGISDGSEPNGNVTRAQMVTMLWRASGSPDGKDASGFTDVSGDTYYAQAVTWAVKNGITTGIGNGKFDPNGTCTRAQIATFLYRGYQVN